MSNFTKGEMCIVGLIDIFNEHASKDEDKYKLSKKEAKELLMAEFPSLTAGDDEQLKNIVASLDIDMDNKIDFQEFVHLVCVCCVLWKLASDQGREGK